MKTRLEDPGHGGQRADIRAMGLGVRPVPVDRGGVCVERLRRLDVGAVLVTPAHQFPTGVVLAADRRAALLEWAATRGAVIIEDDYDAEYRFDRESIGALQGLAESAVAYLGSASKTLAPALRIGWLLRIYGVGPHRSRPGPPALLLGYASPSERDLEAGVARSRQCSRRPRIWDPAERSLAARLAAAPPSIADDASQYRE